MVNLLIMISLSVVGTSSTKWLIDRHSIMAIRASAMVTLLIVGPMSLLMNAEFCSLYSGAVLGGTFVGMTEVGRLKNYFLYLASICFAVGLFYLAPFNKGFGGLLGCLAFLSCNLVFWFFKIKRWF